MVITFKIYHVPIKNCPRIVHLALLTREMLSGYQLKIADFYNTPFGTVRKLVPNFFDKEKYVLHDENWQLYLRLGLKPKEIHCVLEFNHRD